MTPAAGALPRLGGKLGDVEQGVCESGTGHRGGDMRGVTDQHDTIPHQPLRQVLGHRGPEHLPVGHAPADARPPRRRPVAPREPTELADQSHRKLVAAQGAHHRVAIDTAGFLQQSGLAGVIPGVGDPPVTWVGPARSAMLARPHQLGLTPL